MAPYGLASSNRCGAFSASTYPFINPMAYPGLGRRKLTQYPYSYPYNSYPNQGGNKAIAPS